MSPFEYLGSPLKTVSPLLESSAGETEMRTGTPGSCPDRFPIDDFLP